jgi:hypothetical protein
VPRPDSRRATGPGNRSRSPWPPQKGAASQRIPSALRIRRIMSPKTRLVFLVLLGASDLILLALIPFVFFMAFLAVVFVLALPIGVGVGLSAARRAQRQGQRLSLLGPSLVLAALAAAAAAALLLRVLQPDEVEVAPALMLLVIAWGGTSSYLAGALWATRAR